MTTADPTQTDAHALGRLQYQVKVMSKKLRVAEGSSVLTYDRMCDLFVQACEDTLRQHPRWKVPEAFIDSARKRFMGQIATEIHNVQRSLAPGADDV